MSDKHPNSVNVDIPVSRNEATIVFSPQKFARGERAKAGVHYPAFPEITEETEALAKQWFGMDNWLSMINQEVRMWMQSVYDSVLATVNPKNKDEAEFSADLFRKFAEELSTRGETKEEIENQLKALRGKMIEVMGKAEGESDPLKAAGYLKEFMEITKEVKKYDAILESKKRVRKPKTEEEAEETAEPAAV